MKPEANQGLVHVGISCSAFLTTDCDARAGATDHVLRMQANKVPGEPSSLI